MKKRQPIGRALVEGTQNARVVAAAAAALQQAWAFAAIFAEIFHQQIHHRPQVAAFPRSPGTGCACRTGWARWPQVALLFHAERLGVALHHDQAAQQGAVFAGTSCRGLALCGGHREWCGLPPLGASRMPQRYSGIFT